MFDINLLCDDDDDDRKVQFLSQLTLNGENGQTIYSVGYIQSQAEIGKCTAGCIVARKTKQF